MSNTKLALLGGQPSAIKTLEEISMKIVPEKAYKTIEDLLDKGDISFSPLTGEFEKRFAEYIGVDYAVAVCNGTTSIQAALFAVGIKPEDEVIVPSFTYWASAGPVLTLGAIPRFADVDEANHTISAESIEKFITPRTKAIVVVHVWGNPCDMDPIMALAKKYSLKVIEDCSHAHGAMYKGKKVGSIGDVGCFSMQASKVLAAGEGGMMVTNNRECFERATAMAHYERCKGLGEQSPYSRYELTGFGYKHRIHPLAVAIADANLDRLDEMNEVRYRNGRMLEDMLSDIGYINFQKEYEGAKRVFAYHYAQYVPEKLGGLKLKTLLTAISAEGVVCGSCAYGKLHLSPLYTKNGEFAKEYPFTSLNYPDDLAQSNIPNTAKLADTAFLIAPRLEIATEEVVASYAEAYRKVAANVDALLEYERKENIGDKIENEGSSINYFKAKK